MDWSNSAFNNPDETIGPNDKEDEVKWILKLNCGIPVTKCIEIYKEMIDITLGAFLWNIAVNAKSICGVCN